MHAIPQRCADRPLAGGLVVPYVTLIHGGHAAFGVLDADKAHAAFLGRLCQICEQPLDERCFLLVRPADVLQGCSPEPALHPECLPYTADHCPMLNGSRTHYRRSPILASHPAGRPCSDLSCRCLSRTTDEGHAARSASPADRYEAWMIHTPNYRLVFPPERPEMPSGISLDAPVLRRRLLRTATLTPDQQRLMNLFNGLMNGA
ncbi:cell envelope biogenesis protein OmpA [Streptomyces aquilus]|uniref:Cell envelope biogenesis protein OmpA n=1 Tax=Streptomyces aquilus TaxID=2548456 RepID=A0A3Q9C6E5_9ACTN|nr:cell envelope biogenesis protein OmpA [Streptomyces aquilus]AZP14718.1 cell envelope biogenesis protein OmpA [Streptomyces aquilus]AZP22986.1 cell envelope biogenesis protein OmpA [Streptomyces aquilus]